jgi:hypothetical protein
MTVDRQRLHPSIDEVLTALGDISQRAIDACAAGDVGTLAALLEEGEQVVGRLRQLPVRMAPPRAGAAEDRSLDALRRRALQVRALQERLADTVAAARQNVLDALRRLDQDRAGLHGYTGAMPRGGSLDLRR